MGKGSKGFSKKDEGRWGKVEAHPLFLSSHKEVWQRIGVLILSSYPFFLLTLRSGCKREDCR